MSLHIVLHSQFSPILPNKQRTNESTNNKREIKFQNQPTLQ